MISRGIVAFVICLLVGAILIFGAYALGQEWYSKTEIGKAQAKAEALESELELAEKQAEALRLQKDIEREKTNQLLANAELQGEIAETTKAEGERNERTLIAQGVKENLDATARTVNRQSAIMTWWGFLAPFVAVILAAVAGGLVFLVGGGVAIGLYEWQKACKKAAAGAVT